MGTFPSKASKHWVYFVLEDTNVSWKVEKLAESQRAHGTTLCFHFPFISLYKYCLLGRCFTVQSDILSSASKTKTKKKTAESVGQSLSYCLGKVFYLSKYAHQSVLFQLFMQMRIYCDPAAIGRTGLWTLCCSQLSKEPKSLPLQAPKSSAFPKSPF